MDKLATRLTEASINFLVPLRLAEGYSEARFQELCQAVKDVYQYYASSDSLPKNCVSILVDILPGIDGCMSLYKDNDLTQVQNAWATLYDIIIEGLAKQVEQ